MVGQAGGYGLGHGHGQLQGIQFVGFPSGLGVGHCLGLLGGVGCFSGWAPRVGGGVTSFAIGALPLGVAAFCGPVFFAALAAGVFGVPAFLGRVTELLTSVALDWFLQWSVFLTPVFHTFEGEAVFK